MKLASPLRKSLPLRQAQGPPFDKLRDHPLRLNPFYVQGSRFFSPFTALASPKQGHATQAETDKQIRGRFGNSSHRGLSILSSVLRRQHSRPLKIHIGVIQFVVQMELSGY